MGSSAWLFWVKAACKLLSLVYGTQEGDNQRLVRSHLTSDFLSREWATSTLCPWSHPTLLCILGTVSITTVFRTTELPFGIYFRHYTSLQGFFYLNILWVIQTLKLNSLSFHLNSLLILSSLSIHSH